MFMLDADERILINIYKENNSLTHARTLTNDVLLLLSIDLIVVKGVNWSAR